MHEVVEDGLNKKNDAPELEKRLRSDIRQLYVVAKLQTESSQICVAVLQAVHRKSGCIDIVEMRRLGPRNFRSAFRLISLLAQPYRLSDAGLSGHLTVEEIRWLFEDN